MRRWPCMKCTCRIPINIHSTIVSSLGNWHYTISRYISCSLGSTFCLKLCLEVLNVNCAHISLYFSITVYFVAFRWWQCMVDWATSVCCLRTFPICLHCALLMWRFQASLIKVVWRMQLSRISSSAGNNNNCKWCCELISTSYFAWTLFRTNWRCINQRMSLFSIIVLQRVNLYGSRNTGHSIT